MSSEAKREANRRYNSQQSSISIRIKPSVGDAIRAAAVEAGQPLAVYIVQACQERMERDEQKEREWYNHVDMPDPPKSGKQNSGEQK